MRKPIAVYYEQQSWFVPLFDQLDRLGANWLRVDARNHSYDVAAPGEYALLFNRMSPSAWQRGAGHAIFYTLDYLKHLEAKGVRVVNGSRAFAHEISKAAQLANLDALGLGYPKALVVHQPAEVPAAAQAIGYPLVVKPNIGGSGAGIERFDSASELAAALDQGRLSFGLDHTALVQECFTPRDDTITRVEVLGGKYLYAIRIRTAGRTYNLCPGDICQSTSGEELERRPGCPIEASRNGLAVEGYEPPGEIVEAVERIMKLAGVEVGGVEYVIDDRTGRLLYYDVNALSNFVADPERVVGFNPYARLAAYLVEEAESHSDGKSRTGDLAGAAR